MMATERRRNLRAENCRACGAWCEAGAGYLYRDTNGRPNRYTGRFGWFVKCETCHQGGKTRSGVAAERRAEVAEPAPRPWSVAQVRRWKVERTTHEGDVAIAVRAPTFSRVISYRDRINSRLVAPTGYGLEQEEFEGRPLSDNAAKELGARILALLTSIQREEQEAGEAAVAKLTAAGATVTPCVTGHGWRVDFRGGRYTLWGHVGGANRVAGFAEGRWMETTAEALLAESPPGIS